MIINKIETIREISKKIETNSMVFLKNKYVKVSEYKNGIYYDPSFISPISKSAHNLESKILLILQDWASTDYLNKQVHTIEKINTGIDLNLPTNKRLRILLKEFFGIKIEQTYAINLFPYIKYGKISAKIPINDYLYSIENFIDPFIKCFQPNLIIVVGSSNYNLLRRYKDLSKINIKDSFQNSFEISNSIVQGVPHTGWWGTMNVGGDDEVKKIWKSLSIKYTHLIE